METLLIAARGVHFAAAISLAGTVAFTPLIAGAAVARSPPLQQRLRRLAWASLALLLVSGIAWLAAVAAEMSGASLATALSQGTWTTVLTQTRFGVDWLVRFGLCVLLALCLAARERGPPRVLDWAGLTFGALQLAALAWAGHGAATPGREGDVHLAADVLHLLASGLWLGMLVPFALLLAAARRANGAEWRAGANVATRRFSGAAATSVAVLLASGIANTWFLAGTAPALFGTPYGHLLLVKVALFVVLLTIGAVNLCRLGPRLAAPARFPRALVWLRRNALTEAAVGLLILALVGALGALVPGLHSAAAWPFGYRIDPGALTADAAARLAVLAVAAGLCAIIAGAEAAAGHCRRTAVFAFGLALCLGAGWLPLQLAVVPAHPTTFVTPTEPYDAQSVARGGVLYNENCTACHGAGGRGDGPAAAGLRVRPADLTAPHLFAHTPGDLFWWVSHGDEAGVMPGFSEITTADQRWDVVNFIRARAAGTAAHLVGPHVADVSAAQIPDFPFTTGGERQTLGGRLEDGPLLLIVFEAPAPWGRLAALAASRPMLAHSRLGLVAVCLGETGRLPLVVDVAADVRASLALFRSPEDGGESELLLDRNGVVRARWTADNPADAATLAAAATRIAGTVAAAPSHTEHAH